MCVACGVPLPANRSGVVGQDDKATNAWLWKENERLATENVRLRADLEDARRAAQFTHAVKEV